MSRAIEGACTTPGRAAQYVRMSTDFQKYSIENQRAAIATYAICNNLQLVRTYADAGKSGVTAKGRKGLQALMADVESGGFDFNTLSFSTSADGVGTKTSMKGPITNIGAVLLAFGSSMSPNCSRATTPA
jgi:hypothetical protein